MTTRTVQFLGQGYSLPPAEGLEFTPCTITATVSGNVVFSGAIPTTYSSDVNHTPQYQVVLFTFEIPLVTANTANASPYTLPVSLDITGDDVFLEQILTNYCNNNGTTTGPNGFFAISNQDARSNVVVTNGAVITPKPDPLTPESPTGTWGWEIETAPGQTATMTFDMNIIPGLE